MERKDSLDFEDLIEKLGGFGKFQVMVYALASLCSFYSGLFIVSPIFASKTLPYRCHVPFCDFNSSKNIEQNDFLNFSIPWNEEKKSWDSCRMFPLKDLPIPASSVEEITFSQISTQSLSEYESESSAFLCSEDNFLNNETVSCDQWVYDHSDFISTTQSEFDLTCDDEWIIPMEMSSIMAGYLVGSLITGVISDKFGRIFGILFSAITLSFSGIAAAVFSYNYYIFLVLRFLGGIGAMGCFHVAFISAIEYIGIEWRTFCGVFFCVPFSIGEATLGLMAYYIRNWRMLLIANSVPVIIIFSYYWIMPESVRWLVTKNKRKEAYKILQRAASINNKYLPADVEEYLQNQIWSKTHPDHFFHRWRRGLYHRRILK
ncbi:Solute carrier family 22 member 4 [Armadillidium vulgare]|nr:Solute carrier family 22 member 4 [Armadillidium vulgare]